MGRITSNIGLITGLPITDTVNELVAVQARPRDLLVSRNKTAEAQSQGLISVTGFALALQALTRNLGKSELFGETKATSSAATVLSATITGTPTVGAYTYTPVQQAQAHQAVSSGIASRTEPLGGGSFTFRFGGEVDEGLSLDLINGGAGFQRGKIRITDRSGASAEVDLRYARTVDDVLNAINNSSEVNVTAHAVGDRFVLTDDTGQSISNLRVQEVGGNQTAASLGLAGINVAANSAQGADIVSLYRGLQLAAINDRTGVDIDAALPDFTVNFRDGTSTTIDLRPLDNSTLHATGQTTASAGINGQIVFTARETGDSLAGVTVTFEDNASVTAGNETVAYNAATKTLIFQIEAGATTANHVVAALNGNAIASEHFTASLATGSTGAGIISTSDTAATALPSEVLREQTLGSVLDAINRAVPAKLKAELAGNRIVLTDLSQDLGGTFAVTAPHNSPALEALGLDGTAQGGTLEGRSLLSGLKTSLVSRLNGGTGFNLGTVQITDRSGGSASVDLSAAETLDDILTAINNSGVSVTAQINSTRNGIVLHDTSGSQASPFIVASGDATNTAEALGIAHNGSGTTVNSGTLHKQVVSHSTKLAQFNGGVGMARGAIRITGANGATFRVDLNRDSIQTVGDVIQEINRIAVGVKARINDTGDGILLYDTAGGAGTLAVAEDGGNTAASLRLLGQGVTMQVEGEARQAINGSTTFEVSLGDDASLDELVNAINQLNAGVTASVLNDGSSLQPFRLSLSSNRTGQASRLLIDATQMPFTMESVTQGRDALLVLGSTANGHAGILAASSDGNFADLIPGVSLQLLQAQETPVTITIESSTVKLVAGVQAFVDDYNKLREAIKTLTKFDAESGQGSILSGDSTLLRLESDLNRLLSGRFFGVGSIQSLGQVGISFNDDGTLSLDTQILRASFDRDPEALEEFFTKKDVGFSTKLDTLLQQSAGEDSSLLVNGLETLNRRIELNEQRIESMNQRLEVYRQRTLLKFMRLEEAISKLQGDLASINSITRFEPLSV